MAEFPSFMAFMLLVESPLCIPLRSANTKHGHDQCQQYFDVKLPVLSGLIVSEGLRKSSPNVTIFLAKFQSQFDSLYLSLS